MNNKNVLKLKKAMQKISELIDNNDKEFRANIVKLVSWGEYPSSQRKNEGTYKGCARKYSDLIKENSDKVKISRKISSTMSEKHVDEIDGLTAKDIQQAYDEFEGLYDTPPSTSIQGMKKGICEAFSAIFIGLEIKKTEINTSTLSKKSFSRIIECVFLVYMHQSDLLEYISPIDCYNYFSNITYNDDLYSRYPNDIILSQMLKRIENSKKENEYKYQIIEFYKKYIFFSVLYKNYDDRKEPKEYNFGTKRSKEEQSTNDTNNADVIKKETTDVDLWNHLLKNKNKFSAYRTTLRNESIALVENQNFSFFEYNCIMYYFGFSHDAWYIAHGISLESKCLFSSTFMQKTSEQPDRYIKRYDYLKYIAINLVLKLYDVENESSLLNILNLTKNLEYTQSKCKDIFVIPILDTTNSLNNLFVECLYRILYFYCELNTWYAGDRTAPLIENPNILFGNNIYKKNYDIKFITKKDGNPKGITFSWNGDSKTFLFKDFKLKQRLYKKFIHNVLSNFYEKLYRDEMVANGVTSENTKKYIGDITKTEQDYGEKIFEVINLFEQNFETNKAKHCLEDILQGL